MNTRRDSGFTLIELLVVMAIITTLVGLGIWGIPKMIGRGEKGAVENFLLQLHTAIDSYATSPRNGDFPPTKLDGDSFPGVGQRRNDENLGIESVVLCLTRRGTKSRFEHEDIPWPDALDNLDNDKTQLALSSIGETRDLWEIYDPWGTAIVYFHHRDYAAVDGLGLGRATTEEQKTVRCKPWKNAKTKGWYRRDGFQLISAGPDLKFNTDDDITNFQR